MIGLDLLGLASANWKLSETIAALPNGIAIGLFGDETFGKLAISNCEKLIATGKVAAVRVQLHWDYGHKIISIDKLKRLAPKWEAVAKKYPQIKFYLSHSCEYSEKSVSEIQKRVDLLRQLAPSCEPVQTPMKSPVVPGAIVEVHGSSGAKAGGIASTDGAELFNIDAEAWNNRNATAAIRFAWGGRCNMAEAANSLPPDKRTAYPDRKYLTSLVRCMQPKGIPPTPTFVGPIVPIKRPLLVKTHGEDSPGANSRDNRPLIFLPQRTQNVDVVTFTGERIGRLIYFGGYPPNLHRFYSGLPGGMRMYGYEIADKAKAVSGSEWAWVKQGKKFYGPINFAFRCGYFQKG